MCIIDQREARRGNGKGDDQLEESAEAWLPLWTGMVGVGNGGCGTGRQKSPTVDGALR